MILHTARDPWMAGVRASRIAIGSGVVLLADGKSLYLGAPGDAKPDVRLTGLAQPAGGLAVSPSGRSRLSER